MRLSREGIFPLASTSNKTGWTFPGTIQGEGKLAGTTSLFLRLQGCNLRCAWQQDNGTFTQCDTAHSWECNDGFEMETDEIANTITDCIAKHPINHIVITGGEPFLQAGELATLMRLLKSQANPHITIETNGTIFDKEVAINADLLSISPKTDCHDTVKHLISNAKDYQLKFVVSRYEDEERVTSFVSKLQKTDADSILIMPMGFTLETLRQTAPIAAKIAVHKGWRYTPRLHIDIWGNREGV
ncbi:MAG: 7-carboxy-7-deazaguanine synthase QueE [Marinilabiliaceae bacterium]|nr:7-carboxy-7-deazaguanine synthase QueE [Marinilabiliaceae bacterium]